MNLTEREKTDLVTSTAGVCVAAIVKWEAEHKRLISKDERALFSFAFLEGCAHGADVLAHRLERKP